MSVPREFADQAEFLAYAERVLEELASGWGNTTARETNPVAIVDDSAGDDTSALDEARRLQRALFDHGIAWPDGPQALGGLGQDVGWRHALDDLLGRFDLPSRAPLVVGLRIVAPAILAHGSEQLRQEYLPGLFRGDILGCQLFSEPASGSDLASARCSARREGDHWRVNGQKVWTSGAATADIGELLVRTDPEASKHAGLSMFVVDMHAPGVTVRPLRQMTGGAEFNEVFLDDVLVPDSHLLGELGQGWQVAHTSLSSERDHMMSAGGPMSQDLLDALVELIGRAPSSADPTVVEMTGRVIANVVASRALVERDPGEWGSVAAASASINKLMLVETTRLIGDLVLRLAGDAVTIDTGADFRWSDYLLGEPSLHIAGGTDEIQRNLVAQRGLGLPR